MLNFMSNFVIKRNFLINTCPFTINFKLFYFLFNVVICLYFSIFLIILSLMTNSDNNFIFYVI
nr:MAG TPA: hypothetical protein [Caudoviricetes sp.]